MKAFACDEELIISGANLEQNYFADRQDRYVYFGAAGDLASYYHGLIDSLGFLAARVTSGSSPGAVASANLSAQDWECRLRNATIPPPSSVNSSTKNSSSSGNSIDTWVFPTLQCAPLGIHQDERATAALLSAVPCSGSVNLCTAY